MINHSILFKTILQPHRFHLDRIIPIRHFLQLSQNFQSQRQLPQMIPIQTQYLNLRQLHTKFLRELAQPIPPNTQTIKFTIAQYRLRQALEFVIIQRKSPQISQSIHLFRKLPYILTLNSQILQPRHFGKLTRKPVQIIIHQRKRSQAAHL